MSAPAPASSQGASPSAPEAVPAVALSPARAAMVAFLVAGVTLALQILVHRVVSAKLLNNYAFLVISLTMLGFAAAGVALTVIQRKVLARLGESLVYGCCLFALSAVAATALFASSHLEADVLMTRVSLIRSFAAWAPYAFLFTIPFAFAGTMLGALLSDLRLPTPRIYAYDLAGSALGSVVVLPLFRLISVEAAIVAVLLVLVVGVGAIVRPEPRGARACLALTVAALLVALLGRDQLFAIYYPKGSMLAATRDPAAGITLEYKEWDPLARIEVSSVRGLVRLRRDARYASLFGENRAFLARYRKLLTQNNYAFTYAVDYDGTPEALLGIEETIYASAYYASAVTKPKVAVIGVGGGFDVLTALRFDASRITGIEINAATVNILKNVYRDYFKHWVSDPRVTIVNADGRHHLSTLEEKFDIIQLSGVDSYSGTPGAAHVFSENYLYTAEAFDLYLSRLSDEGVINMMRLEHTPEKEMLRALVTAVQALRRLGVSDPRSHIVMLTEFTGSFTALLVKKTPFARGDVDRIKAWSSERPSFDISAEPGPPATPPSNAYQAFLSMGQPKLERAFVAAYPFAIDPVTDDRPFFFNFAFWWHLFPEDSRIWAAVPVLQMSLVLLSALVSLAAAVAVVLPLILLSRAGIQSGQNRGRFATYFSGVAIGYLGIEVALMQQFGLFLGHPNYAISVVLAALLLSSGIGALMADAILRRLPSLRFVAFLLAAFILFEFLLVLPRLSSMLGWPFGARVLMVTVLIFPIGVCLGVFMPTGLEAMKRVSPELVPWAWGINGVFSVLAPLLAVAVSTTFGISALLLSAVPIYLLVSFCLPSPSSGREAPGRGSDILIAP
jgi:spermidine synthase